MPRSFVEPGRTGPEANPDEIAPIPDVVHGSRLPLLANCFRIPDVGEIDGHPLTAQRSRVSDVRPFPLRRSPKAVWQCGGDSSRNWCDGKGRAVQ